MMEPGATAGEPLTWEFQGVLTPRDKEEEDYKYLQFRLPPGYGLIEVSYEYSGGSKSVVDIGILDPEGTFRGWSGSDKPGFSISVSKATPGYVAGEIKPGSWTIILGLAKIAAGGCSYRVLVKAWKHGEYLWGERGVEESVAPQAARKPAVAKGWIKGDLHVHSHHSDGKHGVRELVDKALRLSLDYIAVTDHSTNSQFYDIVRIKDPPVLLIPGVEITTYHGHMSVWGWSWFDFRRRRLEDFVKLVDEVHEKGLIISVDHPRDLGELCIGCDFEFKQLRGFDAVEVWNGPWFVKNWEPLAWWHSLLSEGLRVTAVGGSDYHGGEDSFVRLSEPTTWIRVDSPTVENVISSIKHGRVFISQSPSGPLLELKAYYDSQVFETGGIVDANHGEELKIIVEAQGGEGATLRLITSQGVEETIRVNGKAFKHVKKLSVKQGYMFARAELGWYADPCSVNLGEDDTVFALTNPVYLTV
ncbi:MAG: CehA/McbA family metallohydrolase [Candidatus Brockarchaeota archaeon]|nr:CehA/McbA family metallohydrolase [Candidatus Brockarchaeota archaeon]MBO3809214.1 CehA/McbA family metallohydrolase [Candidatus Brockarchaeota archaeon]